METPTIVYDLDTSGGLMEVRLGSGALCNAGGAFANAVCDLVARIATVGATVSTASVISGLAR